MTVLRYLAAGCAVLAVSGMSPPPSRAAAAPRAGTRLAVVVNATNPIADLTLVQFRDLFLGRQAMWPNGRRVTLVLRQDLIEREAVIGLCCHMTSEEYERHMLRAVFMGDVTSGPKLVASDESIKKFVFNVPGAMGAVAASGLDDTVKVVRIDGRLPPDAGYPLTIP